MSQKNIALMYEVARCLRQLLPLSYGTLRERGSKLRIASLTGEAGTLEDEGHFLSMHLLENT
ncbi:MAG: hypothetical protein V7K41_24475 [Nostoc sp.]|uniref:hypothetical protein n=1 Tax=Nostoc sp. TaxID=1180 RepID=UPI002FFB9064